MEQQAGNLAQAVAIFKLKQQAGRPAAAERSAPDGARNVVRLPAAAPHSEAKPTAKVAKAAGGEGDWKEF
jgi:hypothetical protein